MILAPMIGRKKRKANRPIVQRLLRRPANQQVSTPCIRNEELVVAFSPVSNEMNVRYAPPGN